MGSTPAGRRPRWHRGCYRKGVLNQLRPRILVIDDEPDIGGLLRRFFETTGDYFVETETDPFAAVRRAQVFRPDVLILDVNMPGVNGLEVAKTIRGEPWLRHRPIIFYTGVLDAKIDCYKAGGDGPTVFVPKGTPLPALHQSVERLIAARLELFRAFQKTPGYRELKPLQTCVRIA